MVYILYNKIASVFFLSSSPSRRCYYYCSPSPIVLLSINSPFGLHVQPPGLAATGHRQNCTNSNIYTAVYTYMRTGNDVISHPRFSFGERESSRSFVFISFQRNIVASPTPAIDCVLIFIHSLYGIYARRCLCNVISIEQHSLCTTRSVIL